MYKILFSPVGMSDPIRYYHDGPMLHIIRHFNINKAYIFLTEEAEKYEKMDHRYSEAIKRSGLGCQAELIRSGIEDPSDFDAFREHFEDALSKIAKENPGAEIYANISSGTVQMISSLCIIITNEMQQIIPVQVKTPKKSANTDDRHIKFKDKFTEETWNDLINNNVDANEETATKRYERVILKTFRLADTVSKIKSLIDQYNYSAALSVLLKEKLIFENFEILNKLLTHADLRLKLQNQKAKEVIKDLPLDFDFYPVKDQAADFAEYFYTIKIKQKRGELSEFVIKITPFVTELLKYLVDLFIPLEKLIEKDEKGIPYITQKKLQAIDPQLFITVDKTFPRGFKDHFVNISTLCPILKYIFNKKMHQNRGFKGNDMGRIKKIFNKMNDLEQEFRNKNAHEMTSVSEEDLKPKFKSSRKILQELEKLLCLIFPDQFTKNTFIYNDINSLIISNLG